MENIELENLEKVNNNKLECRVLIVEDEEAERLSLQAALETEGIKVKVAKDGATTEELLKTNFFDVVIVDYRLPDIDGLNLIKKMRILIPDLIPVVVTAYSSVEIAIEAMKMGAYDYMSKPFNIPDLLQTIFKIVEYKNDLVNSKKILSELVVSSKLTYSTEKSSVMIISTPDTNVLVEKKDTKSVLFGKFENIFRSIKNYYWGS